MPASCTSRGVGDKHGASGRNAHFRQPSAPSHTPPQHVVCIADLLLHLHWSLRGVGGTGGARQTLPHTTHTTLHTLRTCTRVARGHFELVQLLLESAVMSEGPERAKRHCIDHANAKRQTALMVACKHGCVRGSCCAAARAATCTPASC